MSESDSDYEEEEVILFADFKNNLMFSDNEDISNQIKIIGIDSDTPIAEVNGNIFKGKYDYSMGTHVFFEEDEDAQIIDPIYENHAKQNFKFFTKTNKVLNFTRIFVEPEAGFSELRSENASDNKHNDLTSLKVDITYEEALKQLKPPEYK